MGSVGENCEFNDLDDINWADFMEVGDSEFEQNQPKRDNASTSQTKQPYKLNRATVASGNSNKTCPFYKKIEGTSLAVDAFSYGSIPGVTAYLLSHFHYDHYVGLDKSFPHKIYCSKVTGNLLISRLQIKYQQVIKLPMNEVCWIEGFKVTLLDANHCPGSVMFLIDLPNGRHHLHTGDFRASAEMAEYTSLHDIHTLYLDTTYCDESYTFPPQEEIISRACNIAVDAVNANKRTLIVCGSYTIGKERIFIGIAEMLNCRVFVKPDKYRVLKCLQDERVNKVLVKSREQASLHVLPMHDLTMQKLQTYLAGLSQQYEKLVAFKPTGWTFKPNKAADIKPEKKGHMSIFGIPYSEHSSYAELRWFIQFVKPIRIIPTVNVGTAKSREKMKACFEAWRGAEYCDIWQEVGATSCKSNTRTATATVLQRKPTALEKWLVTK